MKRKIGTLKKREKEDPETMLWLLVFSLLSPLVLDLSVIRK